ncbi:DUF3237 domain-containing protein [Aspergillus lucknowensis]|uniref:Scytalone dehydratase n=1 Tax=Aspergillus lucknowensis TaxID=176173 RepID=A0ABR4L8P7_9EURO
MLRRVLGLAVAALTIYTPAQIPCVAAADPPAPELSFLYTAFANCKGSVMNEDGPRGTRNAIPIVGGNFTGPRMSGQILDLGADWGIVDPKTGIFSADTRYNLRTDDGADIFVQTSGPTSPSGELHLRLLFETGHENYYWLNNIVAIGTLTQVESVDDLSVLRIDAWNVSRHQQRRWNFNDEQS